jgi:hypothetical protein
MGFAIMAISYLSLFLPAVQTGNYSSALQFDFKHVILTYALVTAKVFTYVAPIQEKQWELIQLSLVCFIKTRQKLYVLSWLIQKELN